MDAAKIENVINRFRPHASDKEPNNIRLIDKATVDKESERLATAGIHYTVRKTVGIMAVLYKD